MQCRLNSAFFAARYVNWVCIIRKGTDRYHKRAACQTELQERMSVQWKGVLVVEMHPYSNLPRSSVIKNIDCKIYKLTVRRNFAREPCCCFPCGS